MLIVAVWAIFGISLVTVSRWTLSGSSDLSVGGPVRGWAC
jgi:hypothetical protein